MNDHWNVLYQVCVFYADRKSKMAAIAGHRLTLDPMGKCSNAFFSETTNMIKAKLYMNVHWTLGSVSSLVSEKKIFEISANQSILLAITLLLFYLAARLAAMILNATLESVTIFE
jgi:hypothetical protein